VRLAIEHAISLLDDSVTDGLSKMTLPRAWWPFKQAVFAPFHPAGGSQIEDQVAVHLGVELEVEVVQPLVRIAEACLFLAPLQQSFAAAVDFV
jgi:hypothetical protein